jgi:maltose O-acetyltransferase
MVKGITRRALERLRGETTVDRLIADGLELGSNVFIARNAYLDPGRPWLISIGDDSVVAPFAVILVHDASMRIQLGYARVAPVVIGRRVFIGANATVLPGSQIGDDSVVGAGAIVHGEVPPRSLVVGERSMAIKDLDPFLERHRKAISSSPTWSPEGWTRYTGITNTGKRAQREALANGTSGYLLARDAPRA